MSEKEVATAQEESSPAPRGRVLPLIQVVSRPGLHPHDHPVFRLPGAQGAHGGELAGGQGGPVLAEGAPVPAGGGQAQGRFLADAEHFGREPVEGRDVARALLQDDPLAQDVEHGAGRSSLRESSPAAAQAGGDHCQAQGAQGQGGQGRKTQEHLAAVFGEDAPGTEEHGAARGQPGLVHPEAPHLAIIEGEPGPAALHRQGAGVLAGEDLQGQVRGLTAVLPAGEQGAAEDAVPHPGAVHGQYGAGLAAQMRRVLSSG
jgi:hypothetical protein